MLNPATGAIVHEFVVNAGSLGDEAGLAHIKPFYEPDGSVRYVYGGDLKGNLWAFDLNAKSTPSVVAVLKDSSGNTQPVTAPPELVSYKNKRIILIGTGRLLDITDFGSSSVRTFYAIADGSTLSNARSSLAQVVYTKATDTITAPAVDWSTGRGWFMDLPAGEQANTEPAVARGLVAFTTNMAGSTDCSASSYLYVIDLVTGGKSTSTTFVGTTISATANSSRASLWLTEEGATVGTGQTTDGKPFKIDVAPKKVIAPTKNAWRDAKR
jgi:type IV pilus assembly protein PilY1